MAYIGNKPTVGNFQICDAISVVNGQAAYTMQVGSVNVIPQSANHMIVSLNGTIQKPNSSYTVSGSTITFASNLVTGDVIDFIQILGDVLDLGVPSDATVTTAKLASTSVTAAKLNNDIISGTTALTSEPADTDEFLVSDAGTLKRIDYSLIKGGGKILQVIEDTLTGEFESSSTSFVATGLTVDITPSSTSSKILVFGFPSGDSKGNRYIYTTIYRDSTNLATGGTGVDGMAISYTADGERLYSALPVMKLDSPNTTSQVTYSIYARTNTGTFRLGQNNQTQTMVVMEVGA